MTRHTFKLQEGDTLVTMELTRESKIDLNDLVRELEESILDICEYLQQGNHSRVADMLQVNRTTLVEKRKRYGRKMGVHGRKLIGGKWKYAPNELRRRKFYG